MIPVLLWPARSATHTTHYTRYSTATRKNPGSGDPGAGSSRPLRALCGVSNPLECVPSALTYLHISNLVSLSGTAIRPILPILPILYNLSVLYPYNLEDPGLCFMFTPIYNQPCLQSTLYDRASFHHSQKICYNHKFTIWLVFLIQPTWRRSAPKPVIYPNKLRHHDISRDNHMTTSWQPTWFTSFARVFKDRTCLVTLHKSRHVWPSCASFTSTPANLLDTR